ncbi:DUF1684 domain-containing protein [Schaalia suimastitidis]|uniref:DUF1684 domain-containing protein n=1 Tax=Schaalia suimastitidis TaxID=121163 RepID=UPI0003F600F1|nr:DUF1684 domain-containing protein [Schaalia suimastitidis]
MFPTPESWTAWRRERTETLSQPHGWLSLTSLTWLSNAPTTLPNFPGQWRVEGTGPHTVTALFDKADQVHDADGAVSTSYVITLSPGSSTMDLTWGESRAEVAQRGDGVIVRIRDPRAPRLSTFSGVPCWDFDSSWVCSAITTWEDATPVEVSSAQPGLRSRLMRVGSTAVALPNGSTATLMVTGERDDASVIFHDLTNGVDTPDWRVAPIIEADSRTWVDFTRSTVFPAHFSPFGTCPMPPAGNCVDMRVEAGEKTPLP